MKKFLSILLVLVLSATLVACGTTKTDPDFNGGDINPTPGS